MLLLFKRLVVGKDGERDVMAEAPWAFLCICVRRTDINHQTIRDWRNGTMLRALSIHKADIGLIPGISYDFLSLLGVISQCRFRRSTNYHQVWPPNRHKTRAKEMVEWIKCLSCT